MCLMNMTMDDLVEKTNFSRYYLSAVINGRVTAPDETIEKINTALNIRSKQMVG